MVCVTAFYRFLALCWMLEANTLTAAGTAYFVAPVGLIEWKGKSLRIPMSEGLTGKYAALIRSWLENIMYGRESHEWGIVIDEAGAA